MLPWLLMHDQVYHAARAQITYMLIRSQMASDYKPQPTLDTRLYTSASRLEASFVFMHPILEFVRVSKANPEATLRAATWHLELTCSSEYNFVQSDTVADCHLS